MLSPLEIYIHQMRLILITWDLFLSIWDSFWSVKKFFTSWDLFSPVEIYFHLFWFIFIVKDSFVLIYVFIFSCKMSFFKLKHKEKNIPNKPMLPTMWFELRKSKLALETFIIALFLNISQIFSRFISQPPILL